MTVNPQDNGATNPQKNHSINLDKSTTVYSNRQSWPDGQGPIGNVNGVPKMVPHYPHIKDLQAKANATVRELPAFTPVCYRPFHASLELITDGEIAMIDSYPSRSRSAVGKSSQY